MILFKKFTYIVLAVLMVYLALNGLIWLCWTGSLLSANYDGGDLARMGYIPGSKLLRKNHFDLPVRHLELDKYQGEPIRVLTIGDSFSNGGGGGKNRYYQDYIASINQCNVLNIEPYQGINIFTLTAIYLNNGFLDRVRPKYLLLSASEKFCIENYSGPMDFGRNMSMKQFTGLKTMGYNHAPGKVPFMEFMSEGNFKFLYYNYLYRYSDHAYFSKTYKLRLDRPLFSVKNDRDLLFYRDDIRKIPLATPELVERLNRNLNTLADMLAKKGIKLYFMPNVDKYTLYSEYIVRNPYPRSTFFEELRKQPRRYTLIDTKEILQEELRKGVKDLYYSDDTHWSWKASEKIFRTVRFP